MTVAPIFLDLDPALQINVSAEQRFHLLPCGAGNAFEHGATLADDDTLVRLTLAEDLSIDLQQRATVLKPLNQYRYAVRLGSVYLCSSLLSSAIPSPVSADTGRIASTG